MKMNEQTLRNVYVALHFAFTQRRWERAKTFLCSMCYINCVIHVMQPTGLRFYSFSNFNTSMRSVELQTKMSFN